MCNCFEDFPNNEMDRCKISEWEVVLGAPDRVNILCLKNNISYNYCTDFMFLVVMMCVTCANTILCLINLQFNFCSVFKITHNLFEFMNKFSNQNL